MPRYYFGYGSNMASRIMRDYCPDHCLIGAARLRDYKLAFTRLSERWGAGVADVIPAVGAVVWGGLYAVSERDLQALDEKEGNGRNYRRIDCIAVTPDGAAYSAMTYTVIDKLPDSVPTSAAYRDTLLQGARELGLPDDYIAAIAGLPVKAEP